MNYNLNDDVLLRVKRLYYYYRAMTLTPIDYEAMHRARRLLAHAVGGMP